jgi:hypothetical protein
MEDCVLHHFISEVIQLRLCRELTINKKESDLEEI